MERDGGKAEGAQDEGEALGVVDCASEDYDGVLGEGVADVC